MNEEENYNALKILRSTRKEVDIPEELSNIFIAHKEELDEYRKRQSIRYSIATDYKVEDNLADYIEKSIEPTFQETLFKYIDEKQIDEVELYKKARIDRRLFSKIRSDKNYHPSFGTVTMLGLALELSTEEFIKLLESASYSLPMNMHSRLTIRYCFDHKIYDVDYVNCLIFTICGKDILFI